MTSTQVVETSVTTTDNSPSQDYTHLDDQTTLSHVILPTASNYCFPKCLHFWCPCLRVEGERLIEERGALANDLLRLVLTFLTYIYTVIASTWMSNFLLKSFMQLYDFLLHFPSFDATPKRPWNLKTLTKLTTTRQPKWKEKCGYLRGFFCLPWGGRGEGGGRSVDFGVSRWN